MSSSTGVSGSPGGRSHEGSRRLFEVTSGSGLPSLKGFDNVDSLMGGVDFDCDILHAYCAQDLPPGFVVAKYGGSTSQAVEIRAAAFVKRLATTIGSFSFAAPRSDAKKDETALIAHLRRMGSFYTQNKHTEGGAGNSGLTTTVYVGIVVLVR